MINITNAFQSMFALLLIAAAISDLRHLRIPNLIPILICILFVLGWFAGFPFFEPWWAHLFHFAAALIVGMLLFHFGWFGGGDAKLYAASALWFAFNNAILLLLVTTAAGAIIVIMRMLTIFLRPGVASRDPTTGARQNVRSQAVPYGLAIAIGGIVSILEIY